MCLSITPIKPLLLFSTGNYQRFDVVTCALSTCQICTFLKTPALRWIKRLASNSTPNFPHPPLLHTSAMLFHLYSNARAGHSYALC